MTDMVDIMHESFLLMRRLHYTSVCRKPALIALGYRPFLRVRYVFWIFHVFFT